MRTTALCLAALLACALPRLSFVRAPETEVAAPARTVILVRHAEKASDDPRDPGLSELGLERARALARLLGHSGATRLFASEMRRTRETLLPLADELGLEVESVPARDPAQLIARLAELPAGTTAVVAGHSNTVPELARLLGVPLAHLEADATGGHLAEPEYDRLFVISLPAEGSGGRALVELRYGDPGGVR